MCMYHKTYLSRSWWVVAGASLWQAIPPAPCSTGGWRTEGDNYMRKSQGRKCYWQADNLHIWEMRVKHVFSRLRHSLWILTSHQPRINSLCFDLKEPVQCSFPTGRLSTLSAAAYWTRTSLKHEYLFFKHEKITCTFLKDLSSTSHKVLSRSWQDTWVGDKYVKTAWHKRIDDKFV